MKRRCEEAKFWDASKTALNLLTLALLGVPGLERFGLTLNTCECGRCYPPDEWTDLGEAGA